MGQTLDRKDTDRYYEEIAEGEEYAIEDARTITEADIANFAGVTSDFHPLHMSERFAEESSPFDGRIAHGHLVYSLTEAVITDNNPKEFSYGHDEVRFVEPVYIGDTLSFSRRVVGREDHDENYGHVVYRYEARNQHGDVVAVGDHIKLCEKRP